MTINVCALLPTYRHVEALEKTILCLRSFGLDVLVVDDGNDFLVAAKIASICEAHSGVTCLRREENGGKGAAVLDGLRHAGASGFTHVLQIDADGQHDLDSVPDILAVSAEHPSAFITGKPVFDASIPRSRLIGRWLTHIWVSINTLSSRVIDTMCGFRVYPLAETLETIEGQSLSLRMGFDTEIVVRLRWAGVDVQTLPVKVIYPEGNISNFSLGENYGLSVMHGRMFFGMLRRIPQIVLRRFLGGSSGSRHWAQLGERGGVLGLSFLAGVYRLFGRRICLLIMSPVVLFFFLSGGEQRRASKDYLYRLWMAGGLEKRPGWFMSLKHFMSFGAAALDKLAAWTGNISVDDVEGASHSVFDKLHASGKGGLMLTAHLGNPEVIRAIGSFKGRIRVNVLVHTAHALRFNALIQSSSAQASVRMIQVTEVGPDTAIMLKTAIDNGEFVVIVGDRIPVTGHNRISWVSFLGDVAPFPQGPHILAAILKVPVYLLFCVRRDKKYRIFFEPFADTIILPRKERDAALSVYVQRYAERLEYFTKQAPLQWFNFFDYWRPAGLKPSEDNQPSIEKSEIAQ